MSYRTRYKRGDWNVICDVSGKELKASQTKLRWDGLRVQKSDYEERHPQDFIRAVQDDPSVPWTRSEGEDSFVDTCIYWESGIADPLYVLLTDSECDAL